MHHSHRRETLCVAHAVEGSKAALRKKVVLEAVRRNGLALAAASHDLRDDASIVLAAVKNNGCALEYASENLRRDRSIVLTACADVAHNSICYRT